MTSNPIIANAKILLGLDSSSDTLLEILLGMVEGEFKDYCNRSDIPVGAENTLLKMLMTQYNRTKAQGIQSQSYSGISETYIDGYSADILKQLNRYRKIKAL